jgi:hypothetical protein
MMARYDSRARERWYAGAFAGRLLGRFECEQRDPQARDRAQSVGLDDHFSPAEEQPQFAYCRRAVQRMTGSAQRRVNAQILIWLLPDRIRNRFP